MQFVWAEKRANENRFVDEPIQNGKYDATISKCFWENNSYMVSEYNPEGSCLVVWLDIDLPKNKVKRIFERISITEPSKFNNLITSAGFNAIHEGDEFDETKLVGTVVNVDVERYTSKNGKISNVAKEYSRAKSSNQKNKSQSTDAIAF